MAESATWLIYHKASVGEKAPQNMDGSTLSYGIAAVPEKDLEKALTLLKDDLVKNGMMLLEIYKCHRTDTAQMPGEDELQDDIGYAIRTAESRGVVAMVTIGDEAID